MDADVKKKEENNNSEDLENTAGGENANGAENEQLDFIMKSGSVISKKDGETIHCLLLVLNTLGGDGEAGLALAEMLAGMSKPTVSRVLGGGHSIGVPMAVSTKKSFIVPSATMTIHPVRMSGTIIGVPQTYYYFERMQDRIVRFITEHSRVSEEKFRELLMRTDQIATDVGSLIDGKEAVEIGLIDSVGSLADALQELRRQIEAKRSADTQASPVQEAQPTM